MQGVINFVLYFISVLLTVICYNLCYIKLNNSKFEKNKTSFIIILLTTICLFFNNCYNNLWIKVILITIIFSVNFKLLYRDEMKRTITTFIFIFLGIVLIEIIFTNSLNKIGFLSNYKIFISYTSSKIILSALVSISECLIFSIKIIKNNIIKFIDFFNDNTLLIYLIGIAYFILGMINIENFANEGSIKLLMILFLIFSILFIIILQSKSKEAMLKETNKRLVEFNDKYGKFLDEYKIYKHNIKHKLAGMKSFGNKKINGLIDDLLEEETNFSVINNNLYNVPNGIKGIVAEKLYNSNINVIIDNKLKIDYFIKLNPKEFNSISESIGICLDNAIEASIATKNPIITLDLYEDKEYVYIKTGNNFCNEIDIEELGDKYYSTKNRGSGLGLFSIKQNRFINEKISIINSFYYIELQIKKAR